jgi:hypothetical protein
MKGKEERPRLKGISAEKKGQYSACAVESLTREQEMMV